MESSFSAALDPTGEVLDVAGELDLANATQFEAALDLLLARGAPRAVVRMAGVTFIDSSGLRALIGGHRKANEHNIELVISEPSEPVRALLTLTALDLTLHVEDEGPRDQGQGR